MKLTKKQRSDKIAPKLTKKQRFDKIAPKRVQSTLKAIRLLKNVSNTSNYEYTEDEANQIIKAVSDELRKMKDAFKDGGEKDKEFSFK